MPRLCTIPNCYGVLGQRKLFRFPRNRERLDLWLRSINNVDLSRLPLNTLCSKRICDKHFTQDCFTEPNRYYLKRGVVPTLWLHPSNYEDPGYVEKVKLIESGSLKVITELDSNSRVYQPIPEVLPPAENSSKTTELIESDTDVSETIVQSHVQEKTKGTSNKVSNEVASTKLATYSITKSIYSCVVPGCQSGDKTRLEFPSFDTDKERFKVWLKIINSPKLDGLSPEEVETNYRICRRHFEPNCLKKNNILAPHAIPTLFVAEPDAGKKWQYQVKLKDRIRTVIDTYDKPEVLKVQSDPVPSPVEVPTDTKCRICLKENENTLPLSYKTFIDGEGSQTICELINKCFNIELSIVEFKPKVICVDCAQTARSAYEFKKCCEASEETLQNEARAKGFDTNDEITCISGKTLTKIASQAIQGGDPNTIVCYVDIKEFEKINECMSNENPKELKPAIKPTLRPNIIQKTALTPVPLAKYPQRLPNVLHQITSPRMKKNMKIVNIIKKCDKSVGVNFKCSCGSKSKRRRSTICVQCQRTFHSNLKFKLYSNVFIAKKRFKCIDCRARFASPKNLNLHLLAHLKSNNKLEEEAEECDDSDSLQMYE